MRFSTLLLVASLLAGPASIARAQSLAEIAQQEAERRKTVSAGKVFTNKDLKPLPEAAPEPDGSAQQPTDASAPAPDGTAATPADDGSKDALAAVAGDKAKTPVEKGEAYWRARMATLREDLERNKVLLAALETRINGLNQDFVSRDDPAQRATITNDRRKALEEQERVRTAVAEGPLAIAAAEEEARQLGVPPGWLR